MIIDRPCTSCGISLEKGVKVVAIMDIVLGCGCVIMWSVLAHFEGTNKQIPTGNSAVKAESVKDSDSILSTFAFYIIMLVFSTIQILLGFLLLAAVLQRKVQLLNVWLVASGLTLITNGFLLKLYEMIVVYAYSEDLKGEANEAALAEFRKLPYVCNIKTQVYPFPSYGLGKPRRGKDRKYTACFQDKSFFVKNVPSVFVLRRHSTLPSDPNVGGQRSTKGNMV